MVKIGKLTDKNGHILSDRNAVVAEQVDALPLTWEGLRSESSYARCKSLPTASSRSNEDFV